jgi:HK97 gp10 family phage protein
VASAPGEPPANDTGNLARSISVVAGDAFPTSTSVVRVKATYAEQLEYGTRHMEPRPFVNPSLADNKEHMRAIIQDELDKINSR